LPFGLCRVSQNKNNSIEKTNEDIAKRAREKYLAYFIIMALPGQLKKIYRIAMNNNQ